MKFRNWFATDLHMVGSASIHLWCTTMFKYSKAFCDRAEFDHVGHSFRWEDVAVVQREIYHVRESWILGASDLLAARRDDLAQAEFDQCSKQIGG